jgi:hypothetical protein
MRCVFLPNRILLTGQRTRLAHPWPAPQLRPLRDAGILLLVRERSTVFPRGVTETGSPVFLLEGAWVGWSGVKTSVLLVAAHVADVIAAPATRQHGIKARAGGRAKAAVVAAGPSRQGRGLLWLTARAFPEGACFHNSSCGTYRRSPSALALCSTADSPLVPSLPGNVVTLPGHFSAGNPSRVCSLGAFTGRGIRSIEAPCAVGLPGQRARGSGGRGRRPVTGNQQSVIRGRRGGSL